MNFDARKDYRQAMKFYISNVLPKQNDEPDSNKKVDVDSKKPPIDIAEH